MTIACCMIFLYGRFGPRCRYLISVHNDSTSDRPPRQIRTGSTAVPRARNPISSPLAAWQSVGLSKRKTGHNYSIFRGTNLSGAFSPGISHFSISIDPSASVVLVYSQLTTARLSRAARCPRNSTTTLFLPPVSARGYDAAGQRTHRTKKTDIRHRRSLGVPGTPH